MSVYHVLPINDSMQHEDTGTDCPCHPTFKAKCQQCDGTNEGCWACERGMVEVLPLEAQVIVHNAADGRE